MDNKDNKQNPPVKEKKEKGRSAERLNEYIRIGSPGLIILIIALAAVAASVIVWGFVGRIPISEDRPCVVTGKVASSNSGVCFIDVETHQADIPQNAKATIRTQDGKVFSGEVSIVVNSPMSYSEIVKRFGKEYNAESESKDTKEETSNENPDDAANLLNAANAINPAGNSADYSNAYSDWILSHMLDESKEFYRVAVIITDEDISGYWHQLVTANIVFDEVTPISFLTR